MVGCGPDAADEEPDTQHCTWQQPDAAHEEPDTRRMWRDWQPREECDAECHQCMERPDKCLKCSSEQDIFYNHTCVSGCPDLYESIATEERGQQCVLTGLICKFDFTKLTTIVFVVCR